MVEIIERQMTPEEEAEQTEKNAQAKQDAKKGVEDARRQAYAISSDPLFFGWQRGDNTEQEWLDAVQAVKDANPYPVDPATPKKK